MEKIDCMVIVKNKDGDKIEVGLEITSLVESIGNVYRYRTIIMNAWNVTKKRKEINLPGEVVGETVESVIRKFKGAFSNI